MKYKVVAVAVLRLIEKSAVVLGGGRRSSGALLVNNLMYCSLFGGAKTCELAEAETETGSSAGL